MRNLSISVAVTALIAFSLGYFARGAVERTPNISEDTEKLAVHENTESPATQAQTIVRTDPNDANTPLTANSDHESVFTSTRSTPRTSYVKNKRDRLRDFFLINGVSHERTEQIIQDLVDADHYIVQKQNAVFDRHRAERAELIAQGGEVEINATAEEKAELKAEQETLYRQVFGEYYEAYEEYRHSYPQRRLVGTFSSSLQEPLEYVAKETVVQIMYEERSILESELESESAGSGAHPTTTPQGWEAEKEQHKARILAMRSFNERVLDRTKAYLTTSQFDQFRRLLDDDVRRIELLIELADIDEPSDSPAFRAQ